MSPFFELSNEIPDTDIFTKGAEVSAHCSLLRVLVTMPLLDPEQIRLSVNITL